MDVHVRELRYFVAVAEELSFTRAAKNRLFVSQPALSKQIRQLESMLKATLLERDRRTVTLTPAGRALLPRARQIVERWDAAARAVAEVVATHQMTLTVGFHTRIGRGLIPRVTARLDEVMPGWRLQFRQVSWGDPTVGLAGGDVDVAIAWLPVPDDGTLSWRVVSTEERWVALAVGHRLADAGTVPFDDLVDEPFIALPSAAGSRRDFWLAAEQRRTPPRVAAEADTAEETFEAVASGLGVVLLSAGNAEVYRRDDVVCLPVSGIPPSQLAVVWRTGDHRETVRVFVEACLRTLGTEVEG
ncbi:LysR family transcriptional regulator [Saccharothrix texasensis]|uniref:LysR family transcriptional regulator n=1 Tax=Saccharothrix texasensis TaxID=103734 RepID=A0A3N1GYW0_9PSEU|nr:LysR family transcriptional regulator [Saccharothrix texasensis]ROP35202.1 LysR family transcriptional regulator [Saccharothrix texasensis]